MGNRVEFVPCVLSFALSFFLFGVMFFPNAEAAKPRTRDEIVVDLAEVTAAAWADCPYSELAENYFNRFNRDPDAVLGVGEVAIDESWRIVFDADDPPLAELAAGYLAEFLSTRMKVEVPVESSGTASKSVRLLAQGGGDPNVPESFTITVGPDDILIRGFDVYGLRDGIVRLVDEVGLREAPFLSLGEQVYRPRLRIRLGSKPKGGSYRDVAFMGYNTVFAGGGNLHALSRSELIPELTVRQVPGALEANAIKVKDAKKHGLKTYALFDTRKKFPKNDPVFQAHPEIRGALTWKADGEYVTVHGASPC